MDLSFRGFTPSSEIAYIFLNLKQHVACENFSPQCLLLPYCESCIDTYPYIQLSQ